MLAGGEGGTIIAFRLSLRLRKFKSVQFVVKITFFFTSFFFLEATGKKFSLKAQALFHAFDRLYAFRALIYELTSSLIKCFLSFFFSLNIIASKINYDYILILFIPYRIRIKINMNYVYSLKVFFSFLFFLKFLNYPGLFHVKRLIFFSF